MPAPAKGVPSAAEIARAGEVFVLAWSSLPPELPEKVSASQLRALVALNRLGTTTVNVLAEELGALPSSITRLCDRLIAAGHVTRTVDPMNRRFHLVQLTSQGSELLAVVDRHRELALERLLCDIPQPLRRSLFDGLAAVAERGHESRSTGLGEPSSIHSGRRGRGPSAQGRRRPA